MIFKALCCLISVKNKWPLILISDLIRSMIYMLHMKPAPVIFRHCRHVLRVRPTAEANFGSTLAKVRNRSIGARFKRALHFLQCVLGSTLTSNPHFLFVPPSLECRFSKKNNLWEQNCWKLSISTEFLIGLRFHVSLSK